MQYIKRLHYLRTVEPFMGKNIIKAITGQRRVGKTYFLLELMDLVKAANKKANIIYINKEYNEHANIQNHDQLIQFAESKINKKTSNHLFIDEIQDITGFEKALRHFHAKEEIEVYCTGSNANMLSGELATYLSGRYIEIKMYSLSYPEFLVFHKLTDNDENMYKYFTFGGLPYLIHLTPEKQVINEYLKNIYNTILYKDVVGRWNLRNSSFLENLIIYICTNTGNIISARRISDFLKSQQIKMSPQLILDYLDYLQQAFFIYKVKRMGIDGRKIFEIGEKYYFEDIGIRNALVGYQQGHINQILENIVFNHLKIAGYEVKIGIFGDKEIDFVAEKSGVCKYIQVTYSITDEQVHKREFGNLLQIKDNHEKIVVSTDPYPSDYQGCKHLHIRNFLKEIVS